MKIYWKSKFKELRERVDEKLCLDKENLSVIPGAVLFGLGWKEAGRNNCINESSIDEILTDTALFEFTCKFYRKCSDHEQKLRKLFQL